MTSLGHPLKGAAGGADPSVHSSPWIAENSRASQETSHAQHAQHSRVSYPSVHKFDVSDLSHLYLDDATHRQDQYHSPQQGHRHPPPQSNTRSQQARVLPLSGQQPPLSYPNHYTPSPLSRPPRTTSLHQPGHLQNRHRELPSQEYESEEAWHDSYSGHRDGYDEKDGPRFSPSFQDPIMPIKSKNCEALPISRVHDSKIAYPFPNHRAGGPTLPLVSNIKTEWEGSTKPTYRVHRRRASSSSYGSESDFGLGPEWNDFLRSRACRRYICLYLIFMAILSLAWIYWAGPSWGEKSMLTDSLKSRMKATNGFFGHNMKVSLQGMIQTQELDRWKIPGSGEGPDGQHSRGNRRLIIVGDVHGCLDELTEILKNTGFNPVTDHLVTTGDMVSRGPSSPEVLSLLISYNASCVRGNHEDRVLLAHRDLVAPSHRKTLVIHPDGSNKPTLQKSQPLKQGAASDLELASILSDEHIKYLNTCPLILDLGQIPGMGRTAVVHAGLIPALPFERQDPVSVMNMRSIDLRSHVPSRYPPPPPVLKTPVDKADRENYDKFGRSTVVPWPKLWNAYQGLIKKRERGTVIYGHDAKAGLQQESWSWGLDGNCVRGGQLAALVLTDRGWGDVVKKVVAVSCKDRDPKKATLEDLGGS